MIKFVQVNLQHSKTAAATLTQFFSKNLFDVALIQEPYVYRGKVRGLSSTGGHVFAPSVDSPRACILVNRRFRDAMSLSNFCSRDVMSIKIKGIFSGNKPEDILIISAYFQGDSHELPPEALREAVEHSHSNNFKLLVGCDSNAHHISWGSSSTNNRGKSLFEFLISNNFLVFNRGSEPTFVTSRY